MTDPTSQDRLSRIETLWSVVIRANQPSEESREAQQQLLDRYGGAIRRYLMASVRDAELADELFQEFALKFVQGGFRQADPSKGQFRSYVKSVLYRMVASHFRKSPTRREQSLETDTPAQDEASSLSEADEVFLKSWRDDLLSRTWQALQGYELQSGVPYHTVLHARVTHPEFSSTELAESLGNQLAKPMTAGGTRVLLHRARDKFATLLLEIIADSLDEPTREHIEAELIEVGLIDYCREFLNRPASQ